MKSTLVIIAVIIIGIIALFSLGGGATIEPPLEVGVVHPLDHRKGVASSTVVLMEYGDFECPACRTYYPILREVLQEYGDKITFVFRHYPLISIHPNAEFSARAAEAAGKQDKFWEMHDLLYEKQSEWSKVADVAPIFESYATLLGLNISKFKTDWVSKEVKDFVRAERQHAVKAGLQGTPTFFLNTKQIKNPNTAEEFKVLLRNALGNNKSNQQSGLEL